MHFSSIAFPMSSRKSFSLARRFCFQTLETPIETETRRITTFPQDDERTNDVTYTSCLFICYHVAVNVIAD